MITNGVASEFDIPNMTDDIEKSNFNPQMLKACTDTSYECGYQQGRADAIEEYKKAVLDAIVEAKNRGEEHCVLKVFLDKVAEQLKEQK